VSSGPDRAGIRASSADHVARYQATDGEDGYLIDRWPTLILTTRGRRSGELRHTPLIFGVDGDRQVLVGSFGGSPTPPAWYLNLTADPEVGVQIKAERFTARARTTAGDERDRLWEQMVELFPYYREYRESTERELPVVVLERL